MSGKGTPCAENSMIWNYEICPCTSANTSERLLLWALPLSGKTSKFWHCLRKCWGNSWFRSPIYAPYLKCSAQSFLHCSWRPKSNYWGTYIWGSLLGEPYHSWRLETHEPERISVYFLWLLIELFAWLASGTPPSRKFHVWSEGRTGFRYFQVCCFIFVRLI